MIRRAILRHVGIPIALLLGLVVLARAGQDNGGGSTTSAQPSGTVSQVSAGNCITLTPTTITTTGSVALTMPASIGCGGTNATSMSTTDGVVYYDGTRLVTTAVGSATQVLTSNGAGVAPTFQAAGGGGVTFPLLAPNGSLSAPSYSFTNGSDSGLFSPSGAHDIELAAGSPGATSDGAALTIFGGPGGSTSGTGGTVTIKGGLPTSGSGGGVNIFGASAFSGNFTGGSVSVQGASGVGSGNGGSLAIGSGHGGNSNGNGGSITIIAGQGGSSTGVGGNITLEPGANGANTAIGNSLASAGNGGSSFHLAGLVNAALTATGNGANTTEDTLQSYSLPANSLDAVGRCIRVTSWGTTANNGDTKTVRLYFGVTNNVAVGAPAVSVDGSWRFVSTICKTGSSTQTLEVTVFTGNQSGGSPTIGFAVGASIQVDTSAIVIKTTGQASAANANDIICTAQLVEFLS